MSFVDILSPKLDGPSLTARPDNIRLQLCLGFIFLLILFAVMNTGDIKTLGQITWIDVVGEGATLIAGLIWLHYTQVVRPPGPVTRALVLGLALLTAGFYLDLLDEFVHFSDSLWGNSLESIVTPIAVIVTSIAASSLYREQQVFKRVQQQREANFRDHRAVHGITNLYNAAYFRTATDNAIQSGSQVSVWIVDLQNFDSLKKEYGFKVADEVLRSVASTLVAAVPHQSLVCHYAGDRFAVLTHEAETMSNLETVLSDLLTHATSLALFHLLKKDIECRVRVVATAAISGEDSRAVLARANAELLARK